MASFGVRDGVLSGLLIADFTDHDDVWRGTHRVAQRIAEGPGVYAHLALIHQRLAVWKEEFDWILDREDMTARVGRAVADHRRERGALARTRCSHDQNQSTLEHG